MPLANDVPVKLKKHLGKLLQFSRRNIVELGLLLRSQQVVYVQLLLVQRSPAITRTAEMVKMVLLAPLSILYCSRGEALEAALLHRVAS